MSKKVAVIDLGSNSMRMAIFERTSRLGFYTLGEYKIKVRLGEGSYSENGVICDEAMDNCIEAFNEFKKIIQKYKINKVLAVGTSALRDASNRNVFINRVKKIGINIKVADGDMEAYLGGIAASNLLPSFKSATTIDIGGGSTELALLEDGKVVKTISLNLGTVRLKELFYDKENLDGLDKFIDDIIKNVPKEFKNQNIIAIGGSLRAISKAILRIENYPLETIHGFSYEYSKYSKLINEISNSKATELVKFPIKKDRYDTIRGGAFIYKKIVKLLKGKYIQTSGAGVREGVFLTNLIGKNSKFPAGFNPSLKSLEDRFIAVKRPNITKYASKIYDALYPLHKVDSVYKKDLITASKLLNIGLRVSFYSRHLHSSYIILNSLNYGYTHKQKALIATIIKLNGKKNISEDEYTKYEKLLPSKKDVIWLSFILKLAKILDELNNKNIKLSFSDHILNIYGIKDDLFIKNGIKEIPKPGIFAISFS
ncbi:guanosine-5'-triphosphate, 3'-diphosphate pyrophosphatase [Campylobacter blaseri]|uniref:Guanosine polyphosphate pyrophosphohydrolase n=1 Tax=Campylobacter blaseri TaxID=2042961 RepID=A0A2P8R187_9BACT|nr:Ppx/GppA phosphatase family protein [Campylobacter blaseri]PSM52252.1 guanosine polyphosphate pyrophosphohydrolase [Campylobacter blaseri]PSM54018.1 guanosine polyphosphate pyrophosphohydrolase [Campylobacter blaseri]QKF85456.1 guanosine-5'-triphosphate, 3'-diphosphate pyrophosphatase [Campylobacter blaseri]